MRDIDVKSMYELETAKFVFNSMHKTLPKPLMKHLTLNTAYHDHHTQQSQVPHCLASNSILHQSSNIWKNGKKHSHQKYIYS